MLDLDKYLTETIDFKYLGKSVKVIQPSVAFVKRFGELSEDKSQEELMDTQIDIVKDFLNNNTSGQDFTKEQIEQLPQKAIIAVFSEITKAINNIDNDPNCKSQSQEEK